MNRKSERGKKRIEERRRLGGQGEGEREGSWIGIYNGVMKEEVGSYKSSC